MVYDGEMAYDSAATRARLLEAARDEFVREGFAGARVDRIAASASANKQAIYAYFGSKEALFDAVLTRRLTVLADAVPMDAADLAGYAGALFDELTTDLALQRLTQWKMLERPGASPVELEAHLGKAQAIAEAHGSSAETAMDAMMLTVAAVQAWNTTPPEIRNPDGGEESARRTRHRAALVAGVGAMADALLGPPKA